MAVGSNPTLSHTEFVSRTRHVVYPVARTGQRRSHSRRGASLAARPGCHDPALLPDLAI